MLFIVGAAIVSIAVATISGVQMRSGAGARTLGWMSEQWLAEHRASHSA